MIRRRTSLGIGGRLICLLLVWAPPLILLVLSGRALVARLDSVLSRSAPLVAAEASRVLQREVTIGRITPDTSVRGLFEMLRNLPKVATIPVTVEDVTIANGTTIEESGALAAVPSGTALVSIPHLLAGNYASAVPRITLQSPTMLVVRNANGRFNLQDLVRRKPGKPGPPFRTVVIIHKGNLTFRDFAARLPKSKMPAVNWLSNVDGYFDLRGTRTIRVRMTALPTPGTATAERLDGTLIVDGTVARPPINDPHISRSLLSVHADNALASYWVPYLLEPTGFQITGGRVDVRVGLVFPLPPKPGAPANQAGYIGSLVVRRGHLLARGLRAPIENLDGVIRLNVDSAQVSGSGSILGARARLSGGIWNLPGGGEARTPQMALTYSLPRVPMRRAVNVLLPRTARLPAGVSIDGWGAINGVLHGTLENPIVAGRIQMPSITAGGQTVRDLTAQVHYAGGIFTLSDIVARAADGRLLGRAVARVARVTPEGQTQFLRLPEISVAFAGKVTRARVASLRLPSTATGPMQGTADVEFVGKYTGGKVTAAANVVTPGMRVSGIEVYAGRARILVTEGEILIPALTASTSAGSARVGGTVRPDGQLDLSVNAVGLDLGRIARVFGKANISGLAYGSGTISGTVRQPVLTAQVRAISPSFSGFAADLVEGTVTATRERLVLGEDVVVRRYPSRATVTGQVVALNTPRPQMDLRVQVEDVEFTEILRQLRVNTATLPRMAGVIDSASVTVRGSFDDPDVRGRIDIGNTFVEEYSIDGGTMQFAMDDGALRISDLRVDVQGAGTLLASGRLEQDGDLTGDFSIPNLNLEAVSSLARRYAELEGTATVRGTVSGTRVNPVIEATIQPRDVRIAGTSLEVEDARVRYVFNTQTGQSRVTLPQLTLSREGTRIQIADAYYDVGSGRVGLVVPRGTIDVATLLETLRASGLRESAGGRRVLASLARVPQPLSGVLQVDRLVLRGRITPEGFAGSEATARLSGTDLTVGQSHVDRLSLNADLDGDVLRLTEFVAVNDAADTTIRAEGTADFDGDIDAVLQTNGANLTLLRPFLPRVDLQGAVDLTIRAQGRTRTPTITASLEGRGVSVAGTQVSLIRIPAATVRPIGGAGAAGEAGQIDTGEILVLQDGHRAQINGQLPFSYEDFTVPDDRPISLSAEASEQSLDLVRLFVRGIPEDKIGGTFSARMDVTGTLRDKQLSGFLRVVDGHLVPPRPTGIEVDQYNSIRDLDVDLRFDGKQIDVAQFTAVIGGPGGESGDYGKIEVGGSLNIANLQTVPRVTGPASVGSRIIRGGVSDLTAKFDNVRIVARDVLPGERGEIIRGNIDGTINIGGSISRPFVTTRAEGTREGAQAPLIFKDVEIQMPERDASKTAQDITFPVNPVFDILAKIEKARLRSAGTFQVDVEGSGSIGGSLVEPAVLADFDVKGGFLRLPTARFGIQKGGEVILRYSYGQPSLRARDLVAKATIYTPAGVQPNLDTRIGGGYIVSDMPLASRRSTRYRITAHIDGDLIDALPGGESAFNLKPGALNLTSDPPLSEGQIIALIGTQQQIALAAQGRVEEALRSEFENVLNNVFVPTLLAPVEQSIAGGLGLEEFSLEYSPNLPVTFRLLKRLPSPLESFLLSYTRSIGDRLQPGEPDPYELSLYYDLPPRLQPGFLDTLQIGVSTNEQRSTAFFLRGTKSF